MTRRRWYAAATIFVLAPLLMAALPSAIENEIRSWFSSSGAAAVVLKARVCPRPRPNTTILCHEQSTNTLKLSVNGGLFSLAQSSGSAGTMLVADGYGGWVDSGCSVSNIGTGEGVLLTCGRFASRDQNFASPGRPNFDTVLGNENNSVTNASCADSGVEGALIRIDTDNANGTQDFVSCLGAREVDRHVVPNFLNIPNSAFAMTGGNQIIGTTNLRCGPFIPTYTVLGATKLAFNVDTADAVNTRMNVCIYNSSRALIMASSRCVGGTNVGAPCAADATCTGSGTCTSASAASTGQEAFTGLVATDFVRGRLYYICSTSNSATSAITTAFNGNVNSSIQNAFVNHMGEVATSSNGFCPLTLGALTPNDQESPLVLVSAE